MTEDEAFLDRGVIADLIATLFEVVVPEGSSAAAYPEVFFADGYRFELGLYFAEAEPAEQVYRLDLSFPLGKINTSREAWAALNLRLAAHLSQMTGKTYHPLSWKGVQLFHEKQEAYSLGKLFMQQGTTGDA